MVDVLNYNLPTSRNSPSVLGGVQLAMLEIEIGYHRWQLEEDTTIRGHRSKFAENAKLAEQEIKCLYWVRSGELVFPVLEWDKMSQWIASIYPYSDRFRLPWSQGAIYE